MGVTNPKTFEDKRRLLVLGLGGVLFIYAVITAIHSFVLSHQESERVETAQLIKKKFNKELFNRPDWPNEINVEGDQYQVKYTFDHKLTIFIEKLLKRYRSDYSTVVVIDNKTGKVLSAVGYERSNSSLNKNLIFSNTHPAASLFKVIASADLIENSETKLSSKFQYRGRGTTLYKYQLRDKKTRWTRSISFEKAFAHSNNVIFGKAAINHSDPQKLFKMANLFGFNSDLMPVVSSVRSRVELPRDDYNLAELASGFNKETMISPLHGAVISSIVANKGVFKKPTIIDEFIRSEDGEKFWNQDEFGRAIIDSNTAKDLQKLMETTVKSGTARRLYRGLDRKMRSKLSIGGKTGSITGGLPHGKRDWLTSYAMPKNNSDSGISVCVMNINVKKWYVKSTFLAQRIIEHYYKNIMPIKKPVVTADYVGR